MAELHARIEALERRLERAEAALRDGGAWGLRLPSVPVTFEDVSVQFSTQEWALLDDGQKELYRSVMQSSYEMLVSLYCDLAKPELLSRIEKEEEPCVPAEPDPEGAVVPPEPAAEPGCPGSASGGALQAEAEESREGSCRDLEGSRSPAAAPDCSTPRVLQGAGGTPAELGRPGPSPPCPVSRCCREVVNLRPPPSPPPAAAGADVGVPTEVPREEVAAEELAVPQRPLEGLQKEDLKDAGNGGRGLVADVPEELGREQIPGLCQAAVCADPSRPVTVPGKPVESACVGRTTACQRGSSREKFYRCVVCGKNFLLKINLIIHQRSHSNWVPYVCVDCNQAFMSKKKIGRHLRIRAATGFCPPSDAKECASLPPCPAAQPRAQGSGAAAQWEKPSPNRYPLSPQKIMYTCSECMENFSSQNFLMLHQRMHADLHHFTLCACCNRSFVWASELLHRHQAERPYWCGECQKAFKRHDHLSGHQKTHSRRESPYECRDKPPLSVAPV
ncbi:zinc finger protein 777-like isoform X1 [Anser cygnoides]|uniref:zinc finger protein 777-like isoform X1 n=1 Tax=Anser cygnoides TaxID=8845 RepID=UPI0034D37791